MNFIKVIFTLVGVYIILGGLASFSKTFSLLDIFGISIGLIPLIIGFYWDDFQNFNFKAIGCVLLFQWLIIFYVIFFNHRSYTIDDIATASTIAMVATAMTFGFWVRVIGQDSQNTAEHHVADSTFKIYDWWYDVNSTNDSVEFRNSVTDNAYLLEMNLLLKQYINAYEHEAEYQNSKSSTNRNVLKTKNKTIKGIEVKFLNSKDTNSTKTFLDYYFQKNGKYYSIHISGKNDAVNELNVNQIKFTVESIISTIN
jgi:hypothetical protein